MRAILLAGGKGTRLRPYTTLVPKPLVPIGGETSILEIVIGQLKRRGFTHLTLAVSHLAHLIESYIGDGSRWDLTIDYSLEPEPLGTIGPLTLLKDLPEDFLVMNGDILTDLDYGAFLRDHTQRRHSVSVSAFKRTSAIDFGVLEYDPQGRLTAFKEKPRYHFDVSMGIYGMSRSVIEALPPGKPYGFDQLMVDGLRNGLDIRVKPFDGFWLDVGRPEDYEYANDHYPDLKKRLGITP